MEEQFTLTPVKTSESRGLYLWEHRPQPGRTRTLSQKHKRQNKLYLHMQESKCIILKHLYGSYK